MHENIRPVLYSIDETEPAKPVKPLHLSAFKIGHIGNFGKQRCRTRIIMRQVRLTIVDGDDAVGLQPLCAFNDSAFNPRTGVQNIVPAAAQC